MLSGISADSPGKRAMAMLSGTHGQYVLLNGTPLGAANRKLSDTFCPPFMIFWLQFWFAALFFASIGMLIHVNFLWNQVDILLASVILVVTVKTLVISGVVKGFGYSNNTSVLVGMSLAQVGEFAFVLLSRASNFHLVEMVESVPAASGDNDTQPGVILQSETIRELTKTSQALFSAQIETSEPSFGIVLNVVI
ncbi:hypothetical protein CASFOL_021012 [Castilleja foliolosa]|uniref:Cation/H+ exchanger transmembrane domain-containing protein n=1 Tax=Castilleja foliolosa TaxID=1961234 RepID=A0ABD3D2G3_9LAMI